MTRRRGHPRRLAVRVAVLCAVAAALPAQQQERWRSRDERERLVRSLQERLETAERDEQRLLDARIRHDLGLELDLPELTVDDADLELARFGGRERLTAERSRVEGLTREFVELRERVTRRREQAAAGWSESRFRAEGVPAATDLRALVERATAQRRAQRAAEEDEQSGPAAGASADPDAEADPGPVVAPMAESADQVSEPATLGHARLHAGVMLLRRADRVAADDAERAETLRARAQDELEAARRILEAACEQSDAAQRDVFALARVCENLGDVVAAEKLFLDVVAAGRSRTSDGTVVFDEWARAARTAMTVMRWTWETRDWRPRIDPRSIDLERLR